MGSRISGTLAILVMDHFEHAHVYRQLSPASSVYVRYVDDTNTIANNVPQAQEMLHHLNTRHPTIKFDLEVPNADGFLPILDIMIKIKENGQISRRHYRKPANRGLTLHFASHHAGTVKKAVLQNEFRHAALYSTIENKAKAISNATAKLIANGYRMKWLQQTTKPNATQKLKKPKSFDAVLRLPFINDAFNPKFRAILRRNNLSNVRLVNPRPTTIQQLAAKPKAKPQRKLRKCPINDTCPNCTAAYVVYEATCEICKATDIGETTRPLHIRAREHFYSIRGG